MVFGNDEPDMSQIVALDDLRLVVEQVDAVPQQVFERARPLFCRGGPDEARTAWQAATETATPADDQDDAPETP